MMYDHIKTFELTDEQLSMVTGGSGSYLPLFPQVPDGGHTSIDYCNVSPSSAILFRKMSNM
jgi:hypothetical protein